MGLSAKDLAGHQGDAKSASRSVSLRWVEAWIGRPFDPIAFNCWHLIREIYQARAGIELPVYGETDARELADVVEQYRERLVDPWREAYETSRPLDVVVMAGRPKIAGQRRRVAVHAGVMVDARRLIHVEEESAAAMVPLVHPSVKFRILGCYRHKDLA